MRALTPPVPMESPVRRPIMVRCMPPYGLLQLPRWMCTVCRLPLAIPWTATVAVKAPLWLTIASVPLTPLPPTGDRNSVRLITGAGGGGAAAAATGGVVGGGPRVGAAVGLAGSGGGLAGSADGEVVTAVAGGVMNGIGVGAGGLMAAGPQAASASMNSADNSVRLTHVGTVRRYAWNRWNVARPQPVYVCVMIQTRRSDDGESA